MLPAEWLHKQQQYDDDTCNYPKTIVKLWQNVTVGYSRNFKWFWIIYMLQVHTVPKDYLSASVPSGTIFLQSCESCKLAFSVY